MAQELIPLNELLNSEEFIAAPYEKKSVALDTWFRSAEPLARGEEELQKLDIGRSATEEYLLRDKYIAEVNSLFPESMRTPENIQYANDALQKWFQDSNGGFNPDVKISFRTQPFTPEELTGVAAAARAGKVDFSAMPPSERKRVEEAMKVDPTNPYAAVFADVAKEKGPVKADMTFSSHEETMQRIQGAAKALKEQMELQMDKHRKDNWTPVRDKDGVLFSFKKKHHPTKNIWQVDLGGKIVEQEFEPGDNNVDLTSLIRDNADALSDADEIDPLTAFTIANSPRKRALAMTGTQNKGFLGNLDDLFVKHVGATSLNLIGGVFELPNAAGSAAQKVADKSWSWLTGDDKFFSESNMSADPIGLNAIARVFSNEAQKVREGRPQSTEDMRLQGAKPATVENLAQGTAGTGLNNGWAWDSSLIADKLSGFASSISQVIASKNPTSGIAMMSSQMANQSAQEIYIENLNAGASEEEAMRRAAIGGTLEGTVLGGMMYATGKAMHNNSMAVSWIRDNLSKVLRVADKQGVLPAIVRGGVVNPIAAAPGNIGVNAAGMTAARIASAFIHDYAVMGDDDPRVAELKSFIGEDGWENFKNSVEFGGGLKDDVVFGALSSALFGSNGIQPKRPKLTAEAWDQYKSLSRDPYMDRYKVLKGLRIEDGQPQSEFHEIVLPDGTSIKYDDVETASIMQQRLADVDRIQESFMEGSKDTGWKWKEGVTPEEKAAAQALMENIRDEIDSNIGYNTRATTDSAIETHETLGSAVASVKNLANRFVLGKGSLDQQRVDMVNQLLEKYSETHKDWSAEKARVKELYMRPVPAKPLSDDQMVRMGEIEAELESLPPGDERAITLQREWDKIKRLGERSGKGMTEAQAEAAANRWVQAQRETAKEVYREKAENQAESIFGGSADLEMTDAGEVTFDVPDAQLGSAIQRNFGIQRREVKTEQGTSYVYDVIFAQPTGLAPDATGGVRKSAAESAAAIESQSAGASAARMQDAQAQRAASQVAAMEQQLDGRLRISDQALLPKSAALSAQAFRAAPESQAPAEPPQFRAIEAPRSARESASRMQQARTEQAQQTARNLEERLNGRIELSITDGVVKSAEESAAVISEQSPSPAAEPPAPQQPQAPAATAPRPQLTEGRAFDLMRGSLLRVPKSANILDDPLEGVQTKNEIDEAIREIDAELDRVAKLPRIESDFMKGFLRGMRRDLVALRPKRGRRSTTEQSAINKAKKDIAQVTAPKPETPKATKPLVEQSAPAPKAKPEVPEFGDPRGFDRRGYDASGLPVEPRVKPAPDSVESTPKAIIEEALAVENDLAPEEASAIVDNLPVEEVVNEALVEDAKATPPKTKRIRTKKAPAKMAAAKAGEKPEPAATKPAEEPAQSTESDVKPEVSSDLPKSVQDAIALQSGKKLPVWLSEKSPKRAFTEADRREIAEHLDVSTTDPVELSRILRERYGEQGSTGTPLEAPSVYDRGAETTPVVRSEADDPGLLLEQRLAAEDAESILTGEDGLTKVTFKDETFWSDENQRAAEEAPAKGLKTSAGKPRRRKQAGSTIIFSEVAKMATNAIKAGKDFAQYMADAIGKWGQQFKRPFAEVWQSVMTAFGRKASQAAPQRPAAQVRPTLHRSPVIDALIAKSKNDFLSPYQKDLLQRIGKERVELAKTGAFSQQVLEDIAIEVSGYDGMKLKTEQTGRESFGREVNRWLTPILSELEKIHPSLRTQMAHYHFNEMVFAREAARRLDGLYRVLKKLSKSDDLALNKAYRNGDVAAQHAILRKNGGDDAVRVWEDVLENQMPHLWEIQQENGIELGRINRYFPSKLKSYEHFRDYLEQKGLVDRFEALADRHSKTIGRRVTPEEAAVLYDMELRKLGTGPGRGAFVKSRTIESLNDETAQFYQPMRDSLAAYMHNFGRNVATAKFFGVDAISQMGARSIDANPSWDGSSMGQTIAKLRNEGKISNVDVSRVHAMISAIANFSPDTAPVRWIKNANPLLVLGKPSMALTQIPAEIVISAMHNGLYNTLVGAGKAFSKTGIRASEIGLTNEFNIGQSRDAMRRFNDQVMKISGFRLGDVIPANTAMNAYLTKLRRMTPQDRMDVVEQYQPWLNRPAQEVAAEIAAGDFRSSDAVFLAYNHLSNIRPIGLASMPKAYMDNSGWGRLLYNMRTWGLFQLDALKRNSYNEIRKGNVAKGIKNLIYMGGLMTMAGASMEEVTDMIYGRDVPFSGRFLDNILKLFFTSRFQIDKVLSGSPSEIFTKLTNAPLLGFLDASTRSYLKASDQDNEDPWWKAFAGNQQFMQALPFNLGAIAYWRWPEVSAEGRMKIVERNLSDRVSQLTEDKNRLLKLGADRRKKEGHEARWEELSNFGEIKSFYMKDAEEAYARGDIHAAQASVNKIEEIAASDPETWKNAKREVLRIERIKKRAARESR